MADPAAPSPPSLSPIVPIARADRFAIDALLDAVFGVDRRRRTAYRIRDGVAAIPELSYAMLSPAGELLGSLQSWPAALDGVTPLVLVGPVAVTPALQNAGIGRALLARLVADADARGDPPLVLIGDPEYYGRFGFDAAATGGWGVPGPVERRRLLARVAAGTTLPRDGQLGPRRPPLPAVSGADAPPVAAPPIAALPTGAGQP